MHSLFVVGCGRSGTSMTAGLFARAGADAGGHLHPASDENPKGYFESAPINKLNNLILSRYVPAPTEHDGLKYQCDAPGARNGWLSRLPLTIEPAATKEEAEQIAQLIPSARFCLKDTRFCYLLHLWRAHAPAAKMVCVFRRPEVVAESILRSCRTRPGLSDVAISVDQAFEIWRLTNQHVLRKQSTSGDWLFVEYDDLLSGAALDRLSDFAGSPIDRSFADVDLRRTQTSLAPRKADVEVYDELRARTAEAVSRQ